MRSIFTTFAALLLALSVPSLSACTTFSAPLDEKAERRSDMAYLYGRFEISDQTQGLGRLRMGLVVESLTNSYTIEFVPSGLPAVIAVPPGRYRATKFVFASYNYESEGEKPITSGPLATPFDAAAGGAYYLADMSARSGGGLTGGMTVRHAWEITSIEDNFSATSSDFDAQFPQFKPLEKRRAYGQ